VELRNHEINLSLGRRKQNGLTREEDVCNLQILGGMKNKKKTQMVISLCVAVTDPFLGKKDG
jgi:hypothetical protein